MSIFNIFSKKKNSIPETTKYNFWLTEEINKCKKFDKDLTKYITPSTHPLHAKWIAKGVMNDFSEKSIQKLVEFPYPTDGSDKENELSELFENLAKEPDLDYFLEKYKPNVTKTPEYNIEGYVGAVLGDIIGSKYEFVEHGPVKNLFDKRSHFTDDTVLTAATIQAIKENKEEPDFRKWYIEFTNRYKNAGYGSGYRRWALGIDVDNTVGYGSYGDGSAMRVSPIGYLYDNIEDVIKMAFKSAVTTHNHINGVKGAVVSAVVCWMCRGNYSKEEIKEYVLSHYGYTKEQRDEIINGYTLFNIEDGENNDFTKNYSLFCDYTVPYCVWCFLETENFDDCMKKVLSHFCDADTDCAIAGSFAYGFYKEDRKEKMNEYLTEDLKNIFENG